MFRIAATTGTARALTYSCVALPPPAAGCERPAMLAMLLILLIAVGNFVLGFVLAAHLGHGPAWADLPSPSQLRSRIRSIFVRQAKAADSGHAAN